MANGGIVGKFNPTSAGPGTQPEKITSFPASGSFTSQRATTQADVLILAGGSACRGGPGGVGGAGAGGLVARPALPISGSTTYPIVVGAGGDRANPSPSTPTPAVGGDSTGFGLTAKGGGTNSNPLGPFDGGCGSGGNENTTTAGNATQPGQAGDSGTYGHGNPGGNGGPAAQGGGGGGTGAAGNPGGSNLAGGAGFQVDYASPTASPVQVTYGGGGGGCGNNVVGGPGGSGGGGGGGQGDPNTPAQPGPTPHDGTDGLGGGGGGSYVGPYNGNGGDGIVVVRELAASVIGVGKGVWRLQTVYDKRRAAEWPGENTV